MPIDPSILFRIQSPAPMDLGSILDRAANLRNLGLQEDRLRQDLDLRRRQQDRLERDDAAKQVEAQQAAQTQSEADAIVQRILSGESEAILATLTPKARVIAETFLKTIDDGKKARAASHQADIKIAAQTAQALGYDPTINEVLFKLIGQEMPEANEIWSQVANDPAKQREIIDNFARFGEKSEKPQGLMNIPSGGAVFDPVTGKAVYENPREAPPPSGFELGPGQTRFDANGNVIASVPAKPETPKEPTRSWILRNGQPVRVTDAEIQPGDVPYSATAAGGNPPTGAQNRTLGFFNRAKQADEDLEQMESSIQQQGLLGQLWTKGAPNWLQTQLGQSYTQAQRAFTEARLRKDSGAMIKDTEYEADRKTYFAEPGDSKETLETKRRARAAILASLAFESGPAFEGFYGPESEGLLQTYRDRSKAAPATGPKPKPTGPKPQGPKADPMGIR